MRDAFLNVVFVLLCLDSVLVLNLLLLPCSFVYETEHFNGVAELLEILGRYVLCSSFLLLSSPTLLSPLLLSCPSLFSCFLYIHVQHIHVQEVLHRLGITVVLLQY